MKKLLCCALAAAMSLSVAAPCFAAGSPWDGTWKLNQAKSKMTGSTFTISLDGGMYTVDTGTIKFQYACDGKDYTIIADRTISCTGGGNSFTVGIKVAGKPYSTTHRTISADGTTLTDVEKGTRPDGTAFTDTETDTRVGSGTGLAGTWQSTKVKNSASSLFILKVNGDVLHYEDPGYKESSDAKLDGTPAPITGGMAPPGLMISNKLENGAVTSTVSLNGKPLGTDVMTLSADGKVLTDVSWSAGKENEKQTYVYDKQ
jgi:hypothetical protein